MGVLAVAWLAAVLSSPDVTQLPIPYASLPPPSAAPTRSNEAPPGVAVGGGAVPAWVLVLVASLFLLVVAVIVGALLWILLRSFTLSKKARLLVEPDKGDPLRRRADEDEVLAAVDAGLVELSDTDGDPRRAVIACWVRLERAAAAAGTPRQVGDSPTDLVLRLLSAHQVSRAVLDRLARVYREARYATHPVDESARQTAIAALRQLRAELAGAGAMSV